MELRREYYLSLTVDGARERVVMIASSAGGMEIEETAKEAPEKILTMEIDPYLGMTGYQAREMGKKLGLSAAEIGQFIPLCKNLYRLFTEKDCSLVEINPLAVDGAGDLVAADAKINFDDNALFRHGDIAAMRDPNEEEAREAEAAKYDLNYIGLDGDIGCMVNGAGLAMATMDIIQSFGGKPGQFSGRGRQRHGGEGGGSVCHSACRQQGEVHLHQHLWRHHALRRDRRGRCGGGAQTGVKVPLVVRLEGTNAEAGKKILAESGLNITAAADMADGAEKACRLAKGAQG